MPKLNFLAAFGVAEAKNALNAFTGVLVRFDPKTAGEADIRLLSAEVEKVAKLKVEAADDLKQLQTHHDQLEANRGRAFAALSVLKGQADGAVDDRAKHDIITKAQLVAHEIQTLDTDLGHDEESMGTAMAWLGEVTKALDEAAQRLADARRNLADAQRDMRRAEQERQLAQRTLDRQKQLSDITRASDSLGVALGTMRNAAADAHKQAAANLQAADAIKRASSSGSDVINEILAGNPQVQASDPFALLENRTITGKPREITG
jgi:chromosome segregation ATPase